jgi:CheY-like chemotaxis protein
MHTACSSNYILLAEDNSADVFLVKQALEEQNLSCELRVIADGEAAMDFIDHLDTAPGSVCPDVLLLDLHLPKRDGEEILKHLRASKRCGRIPVVILTSSDSPRDQRNAEMHTAVYYFRKPSSLEQFMELGVIVKGVMLKAEPPDSRTDILEASSFARGT